MPLLLLVVLALIGGTVTAFGFRWSRIHHPHVPAIVTSALAAAVVAALGLTVHSADGAVRLDVRASEWAARHATEFSTSGLRAVTTLGETWLVAVGVVVVVVVDLIVSRGRSRWALPFLLFAVVGDKLLTVAIKELIDRARPALEPIAATLGPSFPSGHSSTAAVFWAAAALVASRWVAPRRFPLLAGLAVGIAVAVAASRVLLTVHWLTDVVAGLALGWGWFALSALVFGRCWRGADGADLARRDYRSRRDAPVSDPL